jgi:hypothetical protein
VWKQLNDRHDRSEEDGRVINMGDCNHKLFTIPGTLLDSKFINKDGSRASVYSSSSVTVLRILDVFPIDREHQAEMGAESGDAYSTWRRTKKIDSSTASVHVALASWAR